MKTAFLFFCGRPNDFSKKIKKLKQALSVLDNVDFYSVGFSNSSSEFPEGHINFSESDWQNLGYPNKGLNQQRQFSLKPGNCDLPIIMFAQQFSNYEYVYVMEDDVEYTGDIATLLSELAKDNADLLCTHLHDCPSKWDYKDAFTSQIDSSGDKLKLCFLPFFRISKRGLTFIHDAYKEGLYGHHEIVWPYVLLQQGMKVQDIGGDNLYTSPEYIDKYYQGKVDSTGRKNGTFTPTPPKLKAGAQKNTLYHPIKPLKPYLEGRFKRAKSILKYYTNKISS